MAKLKLTIVTPEKEIYSGEADQVNVTTTQGAVGILPHHANLMSQIIPGELTIIDGSKKTTMATGGGLLQIADNNLIIATDLAEKAEDIDEKVVEEAKKRAEAALAQTLDEEEYAVTEAALEKALAQLKVKRRHRRPL